MGRLLWFLILIPLASGSACSGSDDVDPTDVTLGETTFVVVVNPAIDPLTDQSVAAPGTAREGISVSTGRRESVTGPAGIAVLSPVDAGDPVLAVRGRGIDDEIGQRISSGDLVEVALAADPAGVEEMARVVYRFGGQVVEIFPDATPGEVNDALSASNQIVLLRGGVYQGDLQFSGSQVTLFGAGIFGGEVTIRGDVIVSGSGNRIRGARIEGRLTISGSDAGLSFSTAVGEVEVSGSDSVLLENAFCDGIAISGSGTVVLGTRGLASADPPIECR
jgi:hypothetical protein